MLEPPAIGEPGFATKSDLAYTRVRELILSGDLAPGAVLPQASLAQTIGISTTPLREALRRLEQEGRAVQVARGRYLAGRLETDMSEVVRGHVH